jgi:hypothetical protein
MKNLIFAVTFIFSNLAFATNLQGTWKADFGNSVMYYGDYLIFDSTNTSHITHRGMENYQEQYTYKIEKDYPRLIETRDSIGKRDFWTFDLVGNQLTVCYENSSVPCIKYNKTSEKPNFKSGFHEVPHVSVVLTQCVDDVCENFDWTDQIIRNSYDITWVASGRHFPDNDSGVRCFSNILGFLAKPDEKKVESYLASVKITCHEDGRDIDLGDSTYLFLSRSAPIEVQKDYKGSKVTLRISVLPKP